MNTLYITIGNVGSGKSTWAKQFAEINKTNAYIFNKSYVLDADSIRTMLNGGVYNFDVNIEPFIKDTLIGLAVKLIHFGNVIIDGLNHTTESRKKILNQFNDWPCPKAAVLFPPKVEHLERRIKESRGYPEERWREVFNKVAATFEYPQFSEGFSEIIYIGEECETRSY
jgi:predicted kinase